MNTTVYDTGPVEGFAIFIGLLVAGAMLVTITRRHSGTTQWQVRVFLIAAIVRFAASIAIYEFGLVNILKDEDSAGWTIGVSLASEWQQAGLTIIDLPFRMVEAFEGHHQGYKYMVGALFFMTGAPVRMVAAALNCFYGALTCVMAYRIAATLFPEVVARRVAWWTCFWPALIIWSAQTVKEPVVILLECIALYCCVRLREVGTSPKHLTLCLLTTVLLLPFRFYAAFIVLGSVMVGLGMGTLKNVRSAAAGVVLAVALTPFFLGGTVFLRHETELQRFDVAYIESFKKGASQGGAAMGAGSGVQQNYDLRTRSGMLTSIAVGAVHLALAPFPWQLAGSSSLRMLFTLPELVFWWWLFFAGLIPGFRYVLKRRLLDTLPLLIFLVGFGLLYSTMFANVGLVFRQRAQLLPWLLIFASAGLELTRLQRLHRLNPFQNADPYAAPTPSPDEAPSGEQLPGRVAHA